MPLPKLNRGARVLKPFQSVMPTSKSRMSQGRLVSTLRSHNEETHALKGKTMKVASIRAATGVSLGLSKKGSNIFFEEADDSGLIKKTLATSKTRMRSAYEKAVDTYGNNALSSIDEPVIHDDQADSEKKERVEERMKKIHDDIDEARNVRQKNQDSPTGDTETTGATTSIHRVFHPNTLPNSTEEDGGDDSISSQPPVQLD